MSRNLEQVEKEIAAIETSSRALADELYKVVLNYLNALGKAVQKQLILASYHLCTQGYPEAFLALSLKEKQAVQSAIRQVANTAVQELLIWLPLSLKVEENSQHDDDTENVSLESNQDGEDEDEDEDENKTVDAEAIEGIDDNIEMGKIGKTSYEVSLDITGEGMMADLASKVLTNPIQVSRWYQRLEKGIHEILKTVSKTTNGQLKKYKIIPDNLPDMLLEAAAKASQYAEPLGSIPNLLKLTIEVGNLEGSQKLKNAEEREVKQKNAMNLLTIYLRLSEIEFADSVVMAGRNQIRELSHRLNALSREYQKKQQERTIADAEAAWRSSWVEE